MDHFHYHQQILHAESVSVTELAAQWGTPFYCYSRKTLDHHWHVFDESLGDHPHLICYAVKANSNLAVLNSLARQGSGFDIVSGGELARVLAAGGEASKVVFSGVGKTASEITDALETNIHCFNVESISELERLQTIAAGRNCQAPISLRINPDVDAKTHPYIATGLKENKFGIPIEKALEVYLVAQKMPNIAIHGLDCHIGSQLTSVEPFKAALKTILRVVDELANLGIALQHLNMGGGLGVTYHDEKPPSPKDLAKALLPSLADRPLKIILEPGRAIAANAGILVTKVEYLKATTDKNFAIVDAAMNDLLRPTLYQVWQNIIPVAQHSTAKTKLYDIVGPICESGDYLGKARELTLAPNDLIAIRGAGAYGFSMSSNYNSRPRVCELMVDGSQAYCVRQRETQQDLYRHERILP